MSRRNDDGLMVYGLLMILKLRKHWHANAASSQEKYPYDSQFDMYDMEVDTLK